MAISDDSAGGREQAEPTTEADTAKIAESTTKSRKAEKSSLQFFLILFTIFFDFDFGFIRFFLESPKPTRYRNAIANKSAKTYQMPTEKSKPKPQQSRNSNEKQTQQSRTSAPTAATHVPFCTLFAHFESRVLFDYTRTDRTRTDRTREMSENAKFERENWNWKWNAKLNLKMKSRIENAKPQKSKNAKIERAKMKTRFWIWKRFWKLKTRFWNLKTQKRKRENETENAKIEFENAQKRKIWNRKNIEFQNISFSRRRAAIAKIEVRKLHLKRRVLRGGSQTQIWTLKTPRQIEIANDFETENQIRRAADNARFPLRFFISWFRFLLSFHSSPASTTRNSAASSRTLCASLRGFVVQPRTKSLLSRVAEKAITT